MRRSALAGMIVAVGIALFPEKASAQFGSWNPVQDVAKAGEDIGKGVSHVVNEVDKIRRDVQPIDHDFRNNRTIINTPVDSFAFDHNNGRVIQTPSPTRQMIENLPGELTYRQILQAKAAIRTTYALPPAVVQTLIRAGVPQYRLQRVRWSPDWYVTNYLPFTGGMGAVTLEDVIVVRDNRYPHDAVFMAHEMKHVEQYERLGTRRFANEYTTNSWIFENEAENEENRVARAISYQNRPEMSAGNGWNRANPSYSGGFMPVQQVAYTFCATPRGNSTVMAGGTPGATCHIPTAWGPVFGVVQAVR